MAYQIAFTKIGAAFLDLMHQFLIEPRAISMLGLGGAREFFVIEPGALEGPYGVDYDIEGDSLVRQERRAEAQSLYQMAVSAAPVHAQLGMPLNLSAFMVKLLKSFDEPNPQVYFMSKDQAAQQMQPAQQQNGQQPGMTGVPGMPGMPPPTPDGQGYTVPSGPLGSQGNGVTAPPGAGISTSSPTQQMMASSGPTQ
jgi:hypothetical protein